MIMKNLSIVDVEKIQNVVYNNLSMVIIYGMFLISAVIMLKHVQSH